MTALSKIKNLIPAPTDGANAVNYEIIPSVGAIVADGDGNVEASPITVSAYKTEDDTRKSINFLTVLVNGGDPQYKIQYSADGGSWTDCSRMSIKQGTLTLYAYGVPGTDVQAVTSKLALRLVKLVDSAYVSVYQREPLMVVKDGKTGGTGAAGKFYYFDRYFDSTKEYTQTDHAAPYVAFEYTDTDSVVKTNYYMLVAATNKVDDTLVAPRTEAAAGIWELMTTDFAYMIAEAIFSNFAKLGSAIFSGDWMISQYGNGTTDNNYQNFDPTKIESGGWAPNLAIDFRTGKVYINDAVIAGTVNATSGSFTGVVNATSGSFAGTVRARLMYTDVYRVVASAASTYTIDLETLPRNTFFLHDAGQTEHNRFIVLPTASKYDGIEINVYCYAYSTLTSFYVRFTDTVVYKVGVALISGQVVSVPNGEVKSITNSSLKLIAGEYYKFKAMNGTWYVVNGILSGE